MRKVWDAKILKVEIENDIARVVFKVTHIEQSGSTISKTGEARVRYSSSVLIDASNEIRLSIFKTQQEIIRQVVSNSIGRTLQDVANKYLKNNECLYSLI